MSLKIGYFADGKWSHLAFEKMILDDELEIQFIWDALRHLWYSPGFLLP